MNLREVVAKYPSNRAFFLAVKGELIKLAEKKKNFTYATEKDHAYGCSYNKGPASSPKRCSGCIFGQALKKLGWTDEKERNEVCTIQELFGYYCNIEVPKYWSKIQNMNDACHPWGSFLKLLK